MTPESNITSTAATESLGRLSHRETTESVEVGTLTTRLDEFLHQSAHARQMAQIVHVFSTCSDSTGGYVQLQQEYGFIPVLIGNDRQPVFLYEVIEGIDEFLNYDAMLAEFPTLIASQVAGALSFLRQLSQNNTRQIDIDQMEEEFDLGEVREAFENQGDVVRVRPDNR